MFLIFGDFPSLIWDSHASSKISFLSFGWNSSEFQIYFLIFWRLYYDLRNSSNIYFWTFRSLGGSFPSFTYIIKPYYIECPIVPWDLPQWVFLIFMVIFIPLLLIIINMFQLMFWKNSSKSPTFQNPNVNQFVLSSQWQGYLG